MTNTILVKKGAGVPSPDSLQEAELALDVVNGSLYSKLNDGQVHQLNDGADDVDLSDYVTEAPKDTKQYARQDGSWSEVVIPEGGTGSSVHIGDTPPVDPEEGQQWMEVPATGDATMWIYDSGNGGQWLEQPSSSGSGGGADYDDSWIQPALDDKADKSDLDGKADVSDLDSKADKSDLDAKANVGDSYTKAESDSAFQVKGDYIGEAPADGELYVRKDGKWELYTPSSGGGGGFMVPVTPPSSAGHYVFGVKSNSGSGVFKNEMGSWYCNRSSTTATFTVPAGYKFVLQNFIANGDNKDVMINGIYFDGEQINNSSDTANEYKKTDAYGVTDYDKKHLWPSRQNFIIESSAIFTLRLSGDNWFHIFGYFMPADNTRESAELREAYLKEEAERIAAMPVTQEIPE